MSTDLLGIKLSELQIGWRYLDQARGLVEGVLWLQRVKTMPEGTIRSNLVLAGCGHSHRQVAAAVRCGRRELRKVAAS